MIAYGNEVVLHIKQRLRQAAQGKTISFILFGENLASRKFVERKMAFARDIGVLVTVNNFPILPEEKIISIVSELAKRDYDGIIIQLPLPSGVSAEKILNLIPAEKDIDILGDFAKKDYIEKKISKTPPVAQAVKEILDYYNVSLSEKKVLVVGRGKLVGEPVDLWLTREGIEHSIIDKDTPHEHSAKLMKNADIIISGVGSPYMIKPDMIQTGAVLIDAGTSEEEGKLVGDVDPACESKASLYTPVPGGVGPVTVASLFLNII
jgi:methylenetetrahydrofolate dehydrogenase (NADP+)/methenyltetrahydrofolate cyclohydrolase